MKIITLIVIILFNSILTFLSQPDYWSFHSWAGESHKEEPL